MADALIGIVSDYSNFEKDIIEQSNKFHDALNKKDFNSAKEAIENGANVNLHNYYGNDTALMKAIVLRAPKNIINLILEDEADINAKNNSGETALILAIKNNNWGIDPEFYNTDELIKILIKRGADINIKDNIGETASDHALLQDNLLILKILEPKRYQEEIDKRKEIDLLELQQILHSIKVKENQQKQEKFRIHQDVIQRQKELQRQEKHQESVAQVTKRALAEIVAQPAEEEVWAEEPEVEEADWGELEQED